MKKTVSQIRSARALLGWSADRLRTEAGVSIATIQRWEAGKGEPMQANKRAIIAALEKAGVEFIAGGARLREADQ